MFGPERDYAGERRFPVRVRRRIPRAGELSGTTGRPCRSHDRPGRYRLALASAEDAGTPHGPLGSIVRLICMQNRPLIDIQELRTQFFTDDGVVTAVDGVSFSIPCGRTVG